MQVSSSLFSFSLSLSLSLCLCLCLSLSLFVSLFFLLFPFLSFPLPLFRNAEKRAEGCDVSLSLHSPSLTLSAFLTHSCSPVIVKFSKCGEIVLRAVMRGVASDMVDIEISVKDQGIG